MGGRRRAGGGRADQIDSSSSSSSGLAHGTCSVRSPVSTSLVWQRVITSHDNRYRRVIAAVENVQFRVEAVRGVVHQTDRGSAATEVSVENPRL